MNKSESIKSLAAALSAFQGEINNVFKSSAGYGYKYADLAAILDQCRPVLAKNGLSVIQMPSDAAPKCISIETVLAHSSGEWISQVYSLPVPENKQNTDIQNFGGAITYARRYSMAAFLGIAQTDDDCTAHPAYTADDYFGATTQQQKNEIWNNLDQKIQKEIIEKAEKMQ